MILAKSLSLIFQTPWPQVLVFRKLLRRMSLDSEIASTSFMEKALSQTSRPWKFLTSYLTRKRTPLRAKELWHSGKMMRRIFSSTDSSPTWSKIPNSSKNLLTKIGSKLPKLYPQKMPRNVTRDGCSYRNWAVIRLNGRKKRTRSSRHWLSPMVLKIGRVFPKS